MKGMTLHEKGKKILDNYQLRQSQAQPENEETLESKQEPSQLRLALNVLLQAEESFCCVNPTYLQMVDNYANLCLDIVWIYYLLRDLSKLDIAQRCIEKVDINLSSSLLLLTSPLLLFTSSLLLFTSPLLFFFLHKHEL